jgi:hypothetical protein
MRITTLKFLLLVGSIIFLGTSGTALATNSDHSLFDGTNPDNQPSSGAVCGAKAGGSAGTPFTVHIAVSNFGTPTAVLRMTFPDGELVRYQVPNGTSFSLTQEGGRSAGDKAVRFSIEQDGELAGEASATGPSVFCVSCDAVSQGGVGAAACNSLVPVDPASLGAGPN